MHSSYYQQNTIETMRQTFTLLFSMIAWTVFGQNDQTVELQWKIGENEELNYLTIMDEQEGSTQQMNFGEIFKELANNFDFDEDELVEGFDNEVDEVELEKEIDEFFNTLRDGIKTPDFDYVTTLTNKNKGVIDIVMTTRKKDSNEEIADETLENPEIGGLESLFSMQSGVVLRGSVYETGGIHSFWLNSSQKNLIAIFFELPKNPVKIGDKWSLDINLISNDQNFECETAYKINEVELTDIKNINGERIAVLQYNIEEYVEGKFNTPTFFGGSGGVKETMMRFSYQGNAEFSIDRGRWIKFDGLMTMESTGFLESNVKTNYSLIQENISDQ